jgi:hypothetical protein
MAKGDERIVLGSGKVYMAEFTGTIPEDATIETETNRFGKITGGATLEYKSTYVEVKDDLNTVSKVVVTDEEVLFKTGQLMVNGDTFKKITATARVTEAAGVRTVKIGGLANQDGKKYVIRFVHESEIEGDLRVTIVGQNQSGFTLSFKKDANEPLNLEFKALPNDTEGTLVILTEEIPVV